MAAVHLRHVSKTVISLNLSNTKLGTKGCLELSKNLKLISKEDGAIRLQYLDLSYNNIGR